MHRIAIAATSLIALGALGMGVSATREAGNSSIESAASATTQAATYSIDPVHSAVFFGIAHGGGVGKFYGRFNQIRGTFTFDENSTDGASFNITIPLESVDTNNAKRDEHVRGPEFFNVKQFPEATFKGNKVKHVSGDDFEISGTLSLHGESKPVTAKLHWRGTGEMRGTPIAGFEAKFSFKRTDFGITTYAAPDGGDGGGLGNTVEVFVGIEARRE